MQPKKIALISDAWVPQVNGVVTTFQSVIPLLEKKGFEIKILHPEMFNNFSYPWYKEIKISFNTKKITEKFFKEFNPDIVHIMTEGPVGFAGRKYCLKNKLRYTSSFHTRFPDYIKRIKKGDELFYNYGYPFDTDFVDHICKCGSRNCVGYILSDNDWPKLKKYEKKLKSKSK